MHDWGFEASLGYFFLRGQFETYGRTSFVHGPFNTGVEAGRGFHWYPFDTRRSGSAAEVIYIRIRLTRAFSTSIRPVRRLAHPGPVPPALLMRAGTATSWRSGLPWWLCLMLFAQLAGTRLHAEPPAGNKQVAGEQGEQKKVAPAPPPPAPAPAAPGAGAGGAVHVAVRGLLIINMNYNTAGLYPGSQASFALRPDISEPQFFISPQNSVVGIDLGASPVEGAEILRVLAITLRSPQPLVTANTIAPQFYDVHLEAKTRFFRIAFGQTPDVIYPVTPNVLNGMPPGYLPGAIGYTRPQLQGGAEVPLSATVQLFVAGSLARPIQTFELTDTTVGRQAGVPDVQGRVAIAVGNQQAKVRDRPFELGVDGHWGRRRITLLPPSLQSFTFTTWSVGGDVHFTLPTKTNVRGEVFVGALLGDYQAGVFHTVDTTRLVAVRAWGFWGQVEQPVLEDLRIALAYGFDNPNRDDLTPVARARNQAVLLTGLWDLTPRLGFGLEVSRWQTNFVGQSTAVAWRGDIAVFLRFGGGS